MSFTKADLAISTMWNFRKAHSGEELIDQLRELGFERVELNYQVRTEWLSGIRRRIREGAISVSSVHNVFPKTLDKRFDTDSVMLGYEDESLRQQAVELPAGCQADQDAGLLARLLRLDLYIVPVAQVFHPQTSDV